VRVPRSPLGPVVGVGGVREAASVGVGLERHGVTDLLPSPCRLCGSRLGVRYPSGWLCAICEWRHGELPDGDLPPPRIDVVYYLRLGDRVKIGTSGGPRQRIAQLPHDEVVAFERGARMVEQRRHREFAAHPLGTSEWFAFTGPLRVHVGTLGAGVMDPWNLYARWISEAIALHG
jgi:hypothetical protein